jgi:hypothetical protein
MDAMRLVGKSLRSWIQSHADRSAVGYLMNLIVRIPDSAEQTFSDAISLARRPTSRSKGTALARSSAPERSTGFGKS